MKKITKDLITNFKEYLVNGEKSKATVEKYLHDVTVFCAWLGEREVTKALMLEYKELLTESYAPASTNSHISSLNCFFDFFGCHDCKVKTLKIQKQIFAGKEKEFTKAEYSRLLKAAGKNKRLYLIMQTICSCGIRVSELKFITVEAVKRETAEISCKGKCRFVFLPKNLCKELLKYIKENKIQEGSVFITKGGQPVNRSNIWAQMKKLCKAANVDSKKVFPHNLRHLFARTFYSINKDIVRLADVLGHSSVNTTRIYTIETGDIHRRLIQKLGFIFEDKKITT